MEMLSALTPGLFPLPRFEPFQDHEAYEVGHGAVLFEGDSLELCHGLFVKADLERVELLWQPGRLCSVGHSSRH